ncbi:hypothetical protein WR25_17428 isoform B [Diploscapter pachys]|nr:hypothetical protein WR25_17428 isoform B [Diploscapter pachys]
MFYDQIGKEYVLRQPRRIFGLKHDEVMLVDLDSKSKHTAILLDALESTSTTTRKLNCSGTNKVNFLLSFAFAKVLKPSYLIVGFRYEKWNTLNELVEAFPALSELNELRVVGPVCADDDSLLSHLSKFPPSLCFHNSSFLHDGHVVKFLRTLVSTKFEEGSPTAVALKRIVNWTFQMSYETKTEEEATTNRCKLLSELVADIIPPDSEIVNLDSETGAVERRIFELHLAVGDEQHVVYVKEEIDSLNRCRIIQLANQTADLRRIQESPASSTTSDVDEQMPSSDSDPDSDMVDSDEKRSDAFHLDLGHREVRRHFGSFQHFFRRTILVLIRTSRRLSLKIEHLSRKITGTWNPPTTKRTLDSTTAIRPFTTDLVVDWAEQQDEPDDEVMTKVRNLKEIFSPYGEIERVKKVKDYAFVPLQGEGALHQGKWKGGTAKRSREWWSTAPLAKAPERQEEETPASTKSWRNERRTDDLLIFQVDLSPIPMRGCSRMGGGRGAGGGNRSHGFKGDAVTEVAVLCRSVTTGRETSRRTST